MNIRPITEWTLYRLRFALAYSVLAILTVALLMLYGTHIPPGLGPGEEQSVLLSNQVTFTELPKNIVDLPYHALQKLSLDVLGVSPLGVRLPSLIFGALTALCIALLLRRWFKTNIALAGSVIVLTSSWFLSLARLGTPDIMIPFWTSLLLLTATYVSQQTAAWKWWRVAFAMAAAISIYTPFMAYLFIAAGLASLSQPHLRYLLRESNRVNLFIGGFFFILLLVPLGWGIYNNPTMARELLAVPAQLPDPIQFGKDFLTAASNLVNPFNNTTSEAITPALSLVTVVLLLVGASRLLRDFHAVRSHMLLIWAALLVPIVGLNPNWLAVLMVPAMLVIVIGLNQIVGYWYRLFPRNPYARLFGLLPLVVLAFSIVQLNYQRYVYGMLYSPVAGSTFSPDAFMAQKELMRTDKDTPVTLVVPELHQELYKIIGKQHPKTTVATGRQAPQDRAGKWIVSESQAHTTGIKEWPVELMVSDRAKDSLRFRIYQQ